MLMVDYRGGGGGGGGLTILISNFTQFHSDSD